MPLLVRLKVEKHGARFARACLCDSVRTRITCTVLNSSTRHSAVALRSHRPARAYLCICWLAYRQRWR